MTTHEIEKQTRQLWQASFPQDSSEFLDIYFHDKYTPERNIYRLHEGNIVSAAQLIPYNMNFYNVCVHTGYISGLSTAPEFRGRGYASDIIHEAHQRLYHQGAVLSFLIPGDESLRAHYMHPVHGAYGNATFRLPVQLRPADTDTASNCKISIEEEWGVELYVFYKRQAQKFDFILLPSESDFFAAVELCDLEGGHIFVARRGRKIVGICMAVKKEDQTVQLRDIIVNSPEVQNEMISAVCQHYQVEEVHDMGACPGALRYAQPYAMARVIDVPRFFRTILHDNPGLELTIGVAGDLSIPENNGTYMIREGQVLLIDAVAEQIVTPGELAAMFLSAQPTVVRNMLDE